MKARLVGVQRNPERRESRIRETKEGIFKHQPNCGSFSESRQIAHRLSEEVSKTK